MRKTAGADVRAFEAGAEAMRAQMAESCRRTAEIFDARGMAGVAIAFKRHADMIEIAPLPQRATTTEAGNG